MVHSPRRSRTRIKDVAERAGVSLATASLILNNRKGFRFADDTRRRVREAALELGYTPSLFAVSLSRGSTNLIGLYLGEMYTYRSEIATYWKSQLLQLFTEVNDGCFRHRLYPITISHSPTSSTDETVAERLRILVQSGIGGILALGPTEDVMPCLEELARGGTPVVHVFGDHRPVPWLFAIDLDNRAAGVLATRALLDAGYRRIVAVRGRRQVRWIEDRERGYRETLAAAGQAADVLDLSFLGRLSPEPNATGLEVEQAREAERKATDMLAECKADAFFAMCAGTTHVVLSALKQLGRGVPDPCGVVGIDMPLTMEGMAVAHVTGAWDEFGRKALEVLVERMGRDAPAGTGCELVQPLFHPGPTCRVATAAATI